jgi:cob(I)alamin adenosyltransferase
VQQCTGLFYFSAPHGTLVYMLYTRKGDAGTTGVFGRKERFSKSSPIPEALGTLDELNSYLGLCRADMRGRSAFTVPVRGKNKNVEAIIYDIQQTLFIVQAEVAGAKKKVSKAKVTMLEAVTDSIEKTIPPITSFSLAGGTYLSALFDVARTIARRAERRVVLVHEDGLQGVSVHTLAYLNRLSSVLFALARYANHVDGVREEAPTYK